MTESSRCSCSLDRLLYGHDVPPGFALKVRAGERFTADMPAVGSDCAVMGNDVQTRLVQRLPEHERNGQAAR